MVISSIERSKKNKGTMLFYVDGEYAFSISEEDYLTMNLYEKKDITHEEINYIKSTINFSRAKFTAVKYLSLKVRSEFEVRAKLEIEGFSEEVIIVAINELKAIGYINDQMYAQKYIFDRSKLNPKAKKMLRYELEKKGVSGDIIDEALENLTLDDSVLAESLIKKKFGKYDMSDEKILRKIYSFLQHRGFGYGIIREIVNRIKIE